jgi:hypothetical protein
MAERSPDVLGEAEQARLPWLAALLVGVLLLLALLIGSWFLRACAPVDPSTNLTTLETPPPPAPPPPPDPTAALKVSLDEAQGDASRLKAELAALDADLKNKLAHCPPVEPPKPPPPPPPPPPPVAKAPPPPLPADRWAQKDLSMLQGCWRLGHDTQGNIGISGRSEMCSVKAGRICFSGGGRGERETTAVCPRTGTIRCTAPITARFDNDSTLGTTQPPVSCNPMGTSWNGPPNSLTCRRVNDALAICRDRLNFEHEFRRE